MPESGFVLTPCSRACYPWCRCALSVERPCAGEFPELPTAPVNGSFYACALVRYTYRGTLFLPKFPKVHSQGMHFWKFWQRQKNSRVSRV